jgi:hypothetical protein
VIRFLVDVLPEILTAWWIHARRSGSLRWERRFLEEEAEGRRKALEDLVANRPTTGSEASIEAVEGRS